MKLGFNLDTQCRICGNTNLMFLFSTPGRDVPVKERFYLLKCDNCGVIGAYSEYSTITVYNSLYFPEYYGSYPTFLKNFIDIFNNFFLTNRAQKVMKLISSGKVLDYGCGNGDFLRKLRGYGLEVHGVEPNVSFNSPDVKKSLDELNSNIQYDLITLWHVFEHLVNPISEVKRLRKILKDSGKLFLSLPNFDSWESKIGKRKWFHLDVPRHAYHYTPKSITNLLNQCGFSVIKINFSSIFYNTFGIFQTIFNLCGCEQNFFYNIFKRGTNYRKELPLIKWLYNVCFHFMFFLPFLCFSLVFSIISTLFKKSGTMEIICKKA